MPVGVVDRKEETKQDKRPKRGPPLPWPEDAPKAPDRAALNTKIEGYKAEQTRLRKLMDEKDEEIKKNNFKEQRKEKMDEMQELIKKKKDIRGKMQDLRGMLNDCIGKAKKEREESREARRAIIDLNRELGGRNEEVVTPELIDRKIKELEFKQLSGKVHGVKAEKEILNEIRKLKANRAKAEQMAEMATSRATGGGNSGNLEGEIKGLQDKLDEYNIVLDGMIAEIDAKDAEIQHMSKNSEVDKMYNEKRELNEQVRKQHDLISAAYAAFDEQRTAHEEAKKKYDEACAKERQRLRELAEKQREEREEAARKEQLQIAAIKRLNPYADEIAKCDGLIAYLRGGQAVPQVKVEQKPKNTFDPTVGLKGNMAVLKKSEDEDSWLMGSKKPIKKSAGNKPRESKMSPKGKAAPEIEKSKSKPKPLSHPSHRISTFESLGIAFPRNSDEVKGVLDELLKKKEFFESKKMDPKQALAEEMAERAAAAAEQAAAEAAAAAAAAKAEEEE